MFNIKKYFQDIYQEFKEIEWLHTQQILMLLLGIAISVIVLSLFLFLSDIIIKYIVQFIINI